MQALQRGGGTRKVQPWERLDRPVGAYGLTEALHQFLALGVRPQRGAVYWLVD
jgi:hypothetical protein